jgi:hypothetical protein
MNNCDFEEIVVSNDFEVENGLLGLDRDCYLSTVKFLDSSILRKVLVNIFNFFNFLCVLYSTLALVKNHTHERNTFTS